MDSTLEPASADPASVVRDFEDYVNPALAQVLKFIGFSGVESHARGCLVWDTAGRKYLDCLGGYGTMSVGHSHPRVVAAVQAQLERMSQASRVLFNAPQAALAKKLAEVTPGELRYSFFCNSGTEAAEAAIKGWSQPKALTTARPWARSRFRAATNTRRPSRPSSAAPRKFPSTTSKRWSKP